MLSLLLVCSLTGAMRTSIKSSRACLRLSDGRGFFRSLGDRFFGNANPLAPRPPTEIVDKEVVIVGGGAAGLACATRLAAAGIRDMVLLEAGDEVGGRIRTDLVDGFLLDRGFQVRLSRF
jgi:NADPH-dependent 2,4-dienoyl-CoA reductase/sulfur reductase-like enzyme